MPRLNLNKNLVCNYNNDFELARREDTIRKRRENRNKKKMKTLKINTRESDIFLQGNYT